MKIGDKLLCKKLVQGDIGNIFLVDNFYEIVAIGDKFVILNGDKIIGNQPYMKELYLSEFRNGYIWDHFYTKSEMRKRKLKSII